MTWAERAQWILLGVALAGGLRFRSVWKATNELRQQIHALWVQIGHLHDLLGSDFYERTPPNMDSPRARRVLMRLDRDRRSDAR